MFSYLFSCAHPCSSFQLICLCIYTCLFTFVLCQIVMCLYHTFQHFSACLFCVSTSIVFPDICFWISFLLCFGLPVIKLCLAYWIVTLGVGTVPLPVRTAFPFLDYCLCSHLRPWLPRGNVWYVGCLPTFNPYRSDLGIF